MSTISTHTAANRTTENLDATLDRHIDQTSRLVRRVDLMVALLLIGAVLLGGLVLAVLVDHWFVSGGLGKTARTAIFLTLATLTSLMVYKLIVPLFRYTVNPVYAAQILEQKSPAVKNSIINWILLRRERFLHGDQITNALAQRMIDGVTRTAANNAVAIPPDKAIDTQKVVLLGTIMVLLVLFMIGYAALSPKSPLTSALRILLPLGRIDAPQAVRFLELRPGDTVALQGDRLDISAEVVGRSAAPVYLYFSTDDGQAVKQTIPMQRIGDSKSSRYEVAFPPSKQGLVCGVNYWLGQGDSRSGTYRIDVRPVAALEVASLTYRYPNYTGLPEKRIENSSDIRAVEGTEVLVILRSTMPLKQADLLLDEQSNRALTMRVFGDDQRSAQATILLQMEKNDQMLFGRTYSFRAVDQEGFESRRSGTFRIEVLRDQSPIVQWSDTATELKEVAQLDLPLNASMEIPVQAEDPDFALRFLRFQVESGNKRIRPIEMIKSSPTGPTNHTGSIQAKTVFSPIASRLTEGDTAEIWVEAADTKLPEANTASTRKITVRVVAPNQQQKEQPEQKQEEPPKQEDRQPEPKKEPQQEQPKNQADKNEPNQEENGVQQGDQPKDSDKEADKRNGEEGAGNEKEGKKKGETGEKDGETGNDAGNEKGAEKGGEKGDNSNESSDSEGAGSKEGSSDNNKQGQENRKPLDPETQDGDAMERIMEQMKKEGKLENNTEQQAKTEPQKKEKGEGDKDKGEKSEGDKDKGDQGEGDKDKGEQGEGDKDKGEKGEGDKDKGDKGEGEKDKGDKGEGEKDKGDKGEGDKDKGEKGEGAEKSGSGKSQDTDAADSRGGDGGEKTESSGRKPETEARDDGKGQGQNEQSDNADKSGSEQGTGGDKERAPGGKSGGETQGGDQAGDPNSQPERRSGDNRNSDKQDVPVDPSDGSDRQRDDTLDPNLTDRRNQGGDANEPKQTNKDRPQDTLSTGDEGKGRESNQQGQSDRSQSAQDGERGDRGDKAKQEGGSKCEGGPNCKGGPNCQGGSECDGGGSKPGEGSKPGSGSKPGEGAKSGAGKPSEGAGGAESEGAESQAADTPSDPAGKPQNKEGKGESGKPGESGESGEQGTDAQPGMPGESQKPGQSGSSPSQQSEPNQDQQGQGLGGTGSRSGGGGQGSEEVQTVRDEANLEYTEKITNLVLEYLEDQLKDKPSKALLDELGWTEEQLRTFHEKWKRMSEQADQNRRDEADAGAWSDALKSLGIKPARQGDRSRRAKGDFQDEKTETESGRFAPPSKLRDRHKQYTEGIGR